MSLLSLLLLSSQLLSKHERKEFLKKRRQRQKEVEKGVREREKREREEQRKLEKQRQKEERARKKKEKANRKHILTLLSLLVRSQITHVGCCISKFLLTSMHDQHMSSYFKISSRFCC